MLKNSEKKSTGLLLIYRIWTTIKSQWIFNLVLVKNIYEEQWWKFKRMWICKCNWPFGHSLYNNSSMKTKSVFFIICTMIADRLKIHWCILAKNKICIDMITLICFEFCSYLDFEDFWQTYSNCFIDYSGKFCLHNFDLEESRLKVMVDMTSCLW